MDTKKAEDLNIESNGTKFGIYAVKDELTGRFLQPIFVRSFKEVERWFKMVFQENKMWVDNPSHFNLYHLANFEDTTGITEVFEPQMCISGTSIPRKE